MHGRTSRYARDNTKQPTRTEEGRRKREKRMKGKSRAECRIYRNKKKRKKRKKKRENQTYDYAFTTPTERKYTQKKIEKKIKHSSDRDECKRTGTGDRKAFNKNLSGEVEWVGRIQLGMTRHF